jgi:hypothetical protein
MRKLLLPLFIVAFLMNTAIAQEQSTSASKEIKKSIEVEDVNGEVTVTVTETEGDNVSTSVYTGEEALEYLEDHNSEDSFNYSNDDDEKVFIIKSGDGKSESYSWTSSDEMDFDSNEIEKELKTLLKEIDNLNKEEIASQIEEIIELQSAVKEMEIHIDELNEEIDFEMEQDMNVNVEEKDGVILITTTKGNNIEVQEISIDKNNKNSKIVVMTVSEEKETRDGSDLIGTTDNFDVSVYPNPNKGNFTIDLQLKNDQKTMVKVLDSSGKEVYNKTVSGTKQQKLDVKLKKPSAGMYVVIIEQGDEIIKLKTIID